MIVCKSFNKTTQFHWIMHIYLFISCNNKITIIGLTFWSKFKNTNCEFIYRYIVRITINEYISVEDFRLNWDKRYIEFLRYIEIGASRCILQLSEYGVDAVEVYTWIFWQSNRVVVQDEVTQLELFKLNKFPTF